MGRRSDRIETIQPAGEKENEESHELSTEPQ